jgi:glycosyltransferase involved in cell wall biosynthesis
MDETTVGPSKPFPRISIVTPSFNQAEYLEATISSVLSQRHEELEYVVIDGGSTDGSVEIIRRYDNKLSQWVSEPDEGHAHALNKGFALTSGEIMGWINSSDFYLPWTFRVVAEVFASHPEVDWITGAPCTAGSDGVVRSTGPSSVNRYDFLSHDSGCIQQESTFWRRRLWDAVGGLDASLRYAADFDLWARFFARSELYSVSCALAVFRAHDERLGRSGPGSYRVEAATSLQKMISDASARDLRRARFVGLARKAAGRLGGPLLEVCPGCTWYQHPQISYVFDENGWKIHTRRRMGDRGATVPADCASSGPVL